MTYKACRRSVAPCVILGIFLLCLGATIAAPVTAPERAGKADKLPANVPSLYFYVEDDAHERVALADLEQHAEGMHGFAPQSIFLQRNGLITQENDIPAQRIVAQNRNVQVLPLVANLGATDWDKTAAEQVIDDGPAQQQFLSSLRSLADSDGYAGYIFDFEQLSPADLKLLPRFASAAHTLLGPQLQIWFAIPIPADDWPLRQLQRAGATILLMAYDECDDTSTPGPIAGTDWFAPALKKGFDDVDASEVVVALGSWAYDWSDGKTTSVLSVGEAKALANRFSAQIVREPPSLNPHFSYQPFPSEPIHQVWFMDKGTMAEQYWAARELGVVRFGLWRIGLEDQDIWTGLNIPSTRLSAAKQIPPTVCQPIQN